MKSVSFPQSGQKSNFVFVRLRISCTLSISTTISLCLEVIIKYLPGLTFRFKPPETLIKASRLPFVKAAKKRVATYQNVSPFIVNPMKFPIFHQQFNVVGIRAEHVRCITVSEKLNRLFANRTISRRSPAKISRVGVRHGIHLPPCSFCVDKCHKFFFLPTLFCVKL